jgi:hypothetical protein
MSDTAATEARARAQARLAETKRQTGKVAAVTQKLEEVLQQNHFSIRIARTFGLERPER